MNVRKFFIILLIILLAAAACFGGIAVAWFTSKPFASGDHGNALAKITEDGIINFLLVGEDHVGENTDVIMVASLNTKTQKISILSIPRDTRVQVGGKSRKINSVYAYAGAVGMKKEETLINTVSQVSRLPIHYFAVINLRAFRDIVDELGGVEYTLERAYDYDDPYQDLHIHLQPGHQILDGEKAEGLVRYRHDYAMGDIERVGVQQKFLSAFLEQKLQVKYLSKVPAVYEKITDNVISNITVKDVMSYMKEVKDYPSETFLLPGNTNEFSAYWVQDDEKTDEMIREQFGYRDKN